MIRVMTYDKNDTRYEDKLFVKTCLGGDIDIDQKQMIICREDFNTLGAKVFPSRSFYSENLIKGYKSFILSCNLM